MNAIFTVYQTSDDDHFEVATDKSNAGELAFIFNCQPAVNRFLLKIDDKLVTWKDKNWIQMKKMMLRDPQEQKGNDETQQ